jgi:hypothetical protein
MDPVENLLYRDLGEVFLIVVGAQGPSDQENDQCLDALVPFLKNRARISLLFCSLGGMPSLAQTHRMWQAISPDAFIEGIYCAFLTRSTFTRGVVNAMGMLKTLPTVRLKVLDIEQVDEAIRFIETPPRKTPDIKDALASMQRAFRDKS